MTNYNVWDSFDVDSALKKVDDDEKFDAYKQLSNKALGTQLKEQKAAGAEAAEAAAILKSKVGASSLYTIYTYDLTVNIGYNLKVGVGIVESIRKLEFKAK